MNRLFSPLWIFTLLGVFSAFLCTILVIGSAQPAPSPARTAAAASASPSYYAGLSDNRVVIYVNGKAEPVLVTDIDVRTLPDTDRRQLAKGIPLANTADVNRLLEDYSG